MSSGKSEVLRGGEFLLRTCSADEVFIPEEKSEEQQNIYDMARAFALQEIMPVHAQLEQQEAGLNERLLEQAGALGLLGASVPEAYGGFEKDFVTNTFMTEAIGFVGSMAVSLLAHSGIGTLPILYYGTEEQKKKYLPRLVTGELKAAYCLTEPGSGSDALGARTTALPASDGSHYILNGQKMWITNGGFADVFIVFAKVNGTDFTGFIVEANAPGVVRGAEEKKMGIKGSSTRQIFFQDVQVPKENVLGIIGKGHQIAFNVLNIGRHRLAAAVLSSAKWLTELSVQYALQRHQFQQPIAQFGAIQHKLAQQALLTWVNESAVYRSAHDMEQRKQQLLVEQRPYHEALMGAAEEYAIECALLKVTASEMLDYVVDECVQIHGGMGFSEEAVPARAYRDARINRIFEGTNEINRLLSVDMLLKRALKGRLDLMTPALALQQELTGLPAENAPLADSPYAAELQMVQNMKKAFLLVAGSAALRLREQLEQEQEIVMYSADILAAAYLAESALLRLIKMQKQGRSVTVQEDVVRVFLHDALDNLSVWGRNAIEAFAEGDEQKMLLLGLRRFTRAEPFNRKAARRRIAAYLIAEQGYRL
ncbi:MAG: acyl-CoA dehydrogenase family protein [Chitinophagales bacterium]|nr:acyl-CoA dehydrogenase family protein [Chitinophagales bacterium]MDW8393851.1 acyl-CoA dehydrogenase family protein [Chitinophagales bacterium]